jgi:hypothetical protein
LSATQVHTAYGCFVQKQATLFPRTSRCIFYNEGDSLVAESGFTDAPFLLKMKTKDTHELANEIVTGLLGTNQLRTEIPHFMFVYGHVKAAPPVQTNSNEIVLNAQPDTTLYGLVEPISDAMTLARWLETSPSIERIKNIYAQIFFALDVARERAGFSHNDLHTDNVLVKRLDTPRTIMYRTTSGPRSVTTDELAVVIDFGRSHISVPAPFPIPQLPSQLPAEQRDILLGSLFPSKDGITYYNTGFLSLDEGTAPASPSTATDIVRLLIASFYVVRSADDFRAALFVDMLSPVFGKMTRRMLFEAPFGLPTMPLTVDINVIEWADTWLTTA